MTDALLTIAGTIVGDVLVAFLIAGRLHRHRNHKPSTSAEPDEEWVAAEIDRAAAAWAVQQGRPELAPLMADKLYLLHRLGKRPGRAG
jgi:hypothetical protein